MNRFENGDIYLQPLNMIEAGTSAARAEGPPKPDRPANTPNPTQRRSSRRRFRAQSDHPVTTSTPTGEVQESTHEQ
jgi:hypothetical protein